MDDAKEPEEKPPSQVKKHAKRAGLGALSLTAALGVYSQVKDLFISRPEGEAYAQRITALETSQMELTHIFNRQNEVMYKTQTDFRIEVGGTVERQVNRVLDRVDKLEDNLNDRIDELFLSKRKGE